VFNINVVRGDSGCSEVNIFLIETLLYIDTEDEALLRCRDSLFFWTWTFAGILTCFSTTQFSSKNTTKYQLEPQLKSSTVSNTIYHTTTDCAVVLCGHCTVVRSVFIETLAKEQYKATEV